jgi:hypothetical protein
LKGKIPEIETTLESIEHIKATVPDPLQFIIETLPTHLEIC